MTRAGRLQSGVITVCIIALVLIARSSLAAMPPQCTFTVHVVDFMGVPMPTTTFEAELKRGDSSLYRFRDISSQALNADCGDYELWVRNIDSRGKGYFYGRLPLWDGHKDIRLSLVQGGWLHPIGETGIRGEVKDVRDHNIWIRLVPQFYNMTPVRDLVLDSDSKFEFLNINPGCYVLLFMSDGELLATRQAVVYFSEVSELSPVSIEGSSGTAP